MPNMVSTVRGLDLAGWLRGLLSSGISSFAGAIASAFGPALADPRDFNIDHPMMLMKSAAIGAGLCGIVSMAKFLNTQPLPDVKEIEHTIQATTPATADSPKIVDTLKEKYTAPIDAGKTGTGTGDGK